MNKYYLYIDNELDVVTNKNFLLVHRRLYLLFYFIATMA